MAEQDPGYNPRTLILREEVEYIHLGPGNDRRIPLGRVFRWEELGARETSPEDSEE